MLLALSLTGIWAGECDYLVVVSQSVDGTSVRSSVESMGLTVTFADGNIVLTPAEGEVKYLPAEQVQMMYFSDTAVNDEILEPTFIREALTGTEPTEVEVYSTDGRFFGRFDNLEAARRALPRSMYVVRNRDFSPLTSHSSSLTSHSSHSASETSEILTLNIHQGNVTYAVPATDAGEMLFADATTLTVGERIYRLDEITSITILNSEEMVNTVKVDYNEETANVVIAGNIAPWVDATVSSAHVALVQKDEYAGDEFTYELSGA